jgi:hypothetical protein
MVTRDVLDAELRAFKPRATSPFVTLGTIEAFSATQSANDPIDRGSVTIENTDDKLSGTNRITSGDRIEIDVQLRGENSLSRRFTAVARDITDSLEGAGRRTVEIELTGFALSVCSFRNADGAFEGVDVGTVVDSLVAADAPELDRSRIQTVGRTIDINIQGRRLFDVLTQELQPAGDAILAGDKQSLVFRSLGDIAVKHGLTDVDIHAPISVERVDDELRNRVRIDGGIDTAVDDEQLTQSATTRVTDTTRFVQAIETRKSEVDKVQVFTVRDSTSDDNLTVRIQAGRNGSPVDINDRQSDIASRTLAPDFISQSGFTEFRIPSHTLAADAQPFLIIEASGATGHEVGTDGSGELTFKALFPFPLLARSERGSSIQEFRRRDLRVRNDQLETEQAVQDVAGARLRHRAEPKRRFTATANSIRAHNLRPTDIVSVDSFPVADVSGEFVVTERQTEFAGSQLQTEITLEDTTTL